MPHRDINSCSLENLVSSYHYRIYFSTYAYADDTKFLQELIFWNLGLRKC